MPSVAEKQDTCRQTSGPRFPRCHLLASDLDDLLHLNCLMYKCPAFFFSLSPCNSHSIKFYGCNAYLLLNYSTSNISEGHTIKGRGFQSCCDNFAESLDRRSTYQISSMD